MGTTLAVLTTSDANTAADASWNLHASYVWIGLTDDVAKGEWVWVDGTPFADSAWAAGEPNDSGGEDFTTLNWSSVGEWNDSTSPECEATRSAQDASPTGWMNE